MLPSSPDSSTLDLTQSVEDAKPTAVAEKKKAWKPDISSLRDAIDADGNFLAKPKQPIIIQYPNDWRDTTLWVVIKVNPETGRLLLYDPHWEQHGTSNFKGCPPLGFVFKLPDPGDRRPWRPFSFDTAAVKKRHNKSHRVDAEVPVTESQGTPQSASPGAPAVSGGPGEERQT